MLMHACACRHKLTHYSCNHLKGFLECAHYVLAWCIFELYQLRSQSRSHSPGWLDKWWRPQQTTIFTHLMVIMMLLTYHMSASIHLLPVPPISSQTKQKQLHFMIYLETSSLLFIFNLFTLFTFCESLIHSMNMCEFVYECECFLKLFSYIVPCMSCN